MSFFFASWQSVVRNLGATALQPASGHPGQLTKAQTLFAWQFFYKTKFACRSLVPSLRERVPETILKMDTQHTEKGNLRNVATNHFKLQYLTDAYITLKQIVPRHVKNHA